MLTKASYSQDGSDTSSVGTPTHKSWSPNARVQWSQRSMLTEHIEAEYQESYIHTYRLTQMMTIMVKSYIDKASWAE